MTAPATVPLVGKVNFRQTSKEALLQFWQEAERKTKVKINYQERVEEIVRDGSVFKVRSNRGQYVAHSVLLAIGRRGTPRKLGVPGEDLSKVVYRLIDPDQYAGQKVLVVGGGDSALEAAASIAEAGSEGVVLSYRGETFDRAKAGNRERIQKAATAGRMRVLMKSQVKHIEPEAVAIEHGEEILTLPNDAVIVSAGGVLPPTSCGAWASVWKRNMAPRSRRALAALLLLGCCAAAAAALPAAPDRLDGIKKDIRLKNFAGAAASLQSLAAAGDADAQYLMATFYLNGLNGPRDPAQRACGWRGGRRGARAAFSLA
jgi:alkyl hydroperoxide reductase subunit AhpF